MKALFKVLFFLVFTVMSFPAVYAETATNTQAMVEAQSAPQSWMEIENHQGTAPDLKGLLAQAALPLCSTAACPTGCKPVDNTCGDGNRCCNKIQIGLPCAKCTTQDRVR